MSIHKLDLLGFAPHPDDAELFCGGYLLKAAAEGYSTAIVDLSRGELSSTGSLEIREQEISSASEILGLSHRENLELPDGWISPSGKTHLKADDSQIQIKRVVAAIRRLRPAVILLPYFKARHPDHVAASELVSRAAFFAGVKNFDVGTSDDYFSPQGVLYYQMRVSFKPSFIVDISDVAEKKMAAISCYQSQVKPVTSSPKTLIGSPLTISSLRSRDGYYGAMIGVAQGEPYLTKSTLQLSDPVDYFNKHPNKALFFEEDS